jgi:hypothetical protein
MNHYKGICNTLKIPLAGMAFCFATEFSAQLAQAQPLPSKSIFEATSQNLRFSYPSQMQLYETGHKNVVVSLAVTRPGTNQRIYPSFNVIVKPGELEPGALHIFEENVLEEYKQIGLTSVKPVFAHELFFNGTTQRAPYLQLEYQSLGEIFTADITAIPAGEKHFILTYLDKKRSYIGNEAIRDMIFSSFELIRAVPPIANNEVRARYNELPEPEPLQQEDIAPLKSQQIETRSSSYINYDQPAREQKPPTFYALLLVGAIGAMAFFSSVGRGKSKES